MSVFIPIPKKENAKECLHYHTNCIHFTCYPTNAQNSPRQATTVCETRMSRCSRWIQKRQRNQRSNSNFHWMLEKAKEFQKNIYFCFINYVKTFDHVDYNKLWKILQEMGIPEHLTCLLRSLYTGQEATVRTGHGTTDWCTSGSAGAQIVAWRLRLSRVFLACESCRVHCHSLVFSSWLLLISR